MLPTAIYDDNVRLAQRHLESRSLFTSLSVRSREIFVRKSYLYRCSTLFAHISTIMYNSLGTYLHLCIFNSHMPNPYPHPTNNVGRVSACIPNFSEFRHCIGWGEEELQKKNREGCPTCIL